MKASQQCLLQWNMGAAQSCSPGELRQRVSILRDIVRDANPEIVLLQEAPSGLRAVAHSLMYDIHEGVDGRLATMYRRQNWIADVSTAHYREKHHMLTLVESLRGRTRLAVWNLHLASRLRRQDKGIEHMLCEKFYHGVLGAARENPVYVARHEILCGDFNLQPFEDGFLRINAHRSLSWLLRRRRRGGAAFPLFNASWPLLASVGGPAGTYFRRGEVDEPWYVYDQALLSPSIATAAPPRLVRSVAHVALDKHDYAQPNSAVGSDHFPVIVPFSAGVVDASAAPPSF